MDFRGSKDRVYADMESANSREFKEVICGLEDRVFVDVAGARLFLTSSRATSPRGVERSRSRFVGAVSC